MQQTMQQTIEQAAPAAATGRSAALALLALAAASFGIGTTEFVIMGLLPEMAADLGVGIPTAGLLVSGYALSVTFGSPLVAVALSRLDRRRALLVLVGLFILGNALCALSPDYRLLMLARIVTALCHGAFFGLGAVVAADLVPPQRKASAIAIMFTGLTLANVLGVPFGTALGHALGWRATFWAVVGIGFVAAAALVAWLPRHLARDGGSLLSEMRTLRRTQVVLAMLLSVLASASLFSVFTYVAPLLAATAGASPSAITGVLLLFGVGLTLGNGLGGRLGDWRLMPSVIGLGFALAVVLWPWCRRAGRSSRPPRSHRPVGHPRLRAGGAAPDAGAHRRRRGPQPRLDGEPGRLQPRQRHRRLARRRRDHGGPALRPPAGDRGGAGARGGRNRHGGAPAGPVKPSASHA